MRSIFILLLISLLLISFGCIQDSNNIEKYACGDSGDCVWDGQSCLNSEYSDLNESHSCACVNGVCTAIEYGSKNEI